MLLTFGHQILCKMFQRSFITGWKGLRILLWVNSWTFSDAVGTVVSKECLATYHTTRSMGQFTSSLKPRGPALGKPPSGAAVVHRDIRNDRLCSDSLFFSLTWCSWGKKGKDQNSWLFYVSWASATAALIVHVKEFESELSSFPHDISSCSQYGHSNLSLCLQIL